MRKFELGFLLLALTVTSCSGGNERAGSVKSSGNSSAARTGTTATSPSRLCSLFTSVEIKELLGAPVGEGHVAGPLDSACQWDGSSSGDDPVYAQIQLINDTHYWEKHTGAKGYEALRGIGKEAFVASSLGGWEAGTVTDKAVVFVSVSGGSASRDTAVKFLRTSLERLGMK
ncbi:MAG TPA: hypothetical protein VGJ55_05890 [Pyrinomonadaceae bacterium]|jgi:hypothetical protein